MYAYPVCIGTVSVSAQALTCRELGLSAKAREAPLAPPGAAGLVTAAKARVDIAAQLKRMRD